MPNEIPNEIPNKIPNKIVERPKKSMAIAVFLYAGGLYAAGVKKGGILCAVLWAVGLILSQVAQELLPIVTIASCFITYKWMKAYNSGAEV
ncbi:MAG: hypothetical protein ACI4OA_05865 [Selenomonadaceae bacterium]